MVKSHSCAAISTPSAVPAVLFCSLSVVSDTLVYTHCTWGPYHASCNEPGTLAVSHACTLSMHTPSLVPSL